jgi:hypothetical protein
MTRSVSRRMAFILVFAVGVPAVSPRRRGDATDSLERRKTHPFA